MTQISVEINKKEITVDMPKRGPRGPSGNTSKGITVQIPNSFEDIAFMKVEEEMTIASIQAIVKGSNPQVTFNVVKGQDRLLPGISLFTANQICTDQNTGSTHISDDILLSPGDIVRLQILSLSGTVEEFHLSIHFVGQ